MGRLSSPHRPTSRLAGKHRRGAWCLGLKFQIACARDANTILFRDGGSVGQGNQGRGGEEKRRAMRCLQCLINMGRVPLVLTKRVGGG